jgi:two-component system nitrate/nitrite response regulator NarL
MPDLRVLIVASDLLARTGLAALLTDQPGCTIVGQVAAETDWPAALEAYRPDVAVWDLGWDPTPALERLSSLADMEIPVVALIPDNAHAAEVWAAGARGLLLRHVDIASLVTALTAAAQGLAVLDPSLAPVAPPTRERRIEPFIETLTPRERQVLQLLAEGLPNKAIARHLNISEHTVKFHVNAILGKLGAQNRTEAVTRGVQLGLIPI